MGINEDLFERAQHAIPGGVNSPVRAFRSVGGAPRFIEKALGPHIFDAEGKRYIDYIGSWGPMILGHNHPKVVEAVHNAVNKGLSFGAPTEGEILIAEEIKKLIPSIELVRFVSSGTEAGMSAIRLARGYTGRNKIIKFEGCYHGHSDALLVKAGSGLLTFGTPSSSGVPAATTADTLVLEYNNPQMLRDVFAKEGSEIACVIVEAIAGNMNLVPATEEFIRTMRELTTQYGAVLIVDEVMTGFRCAMKGAQSLYGVTPDITMFGKVIGGGMPVAAFGGREEIMNCIAPLGSVYQAGTLSGNPVAVACGLTTLKLIQEPGFYEHLTAQTRKLIEGLVQAAHEEGVAFSGQSVGGMFGIYFRDRCPTSFKEVMECDADRFKTFFHAMLDEGVYLAPSIYEAGFVSATHDDSVIARTVEAAKKAFRKVKQIHG
jgi:glutamate-1-semialdehyde 2,1-aminomutase